MILTTLETRHFTFHALGTTKRQAFEAMRDGWLRHCAETGAEMTWAELKDDVSWMEIEPDVCYRDGERLKPHRDSSGTVIEPTYKTISYDNRIVLVSANRQVVIVACATCGEQFTYGWTSTDREDYPTPGAFAEYCLDNAADNTVAGGDDEHVCEKGVRR